MNVKIDHIMIVNAVAPSPLVVRALFITNTEAKLRQIVPAERFPCDKSSPIATAFSSRTHFAISAKVSSFDAGGNFLEKEGAPLVILIMPLVMTLRLQTQSRSLNAWMASVNRESSSSRSSRVSTGPDTAFPIVAGSADIFWALTFTTDGDVDGSLV